MAYTEDENAGGLDALTNSTIASGDLFVVGDVSDTNRAKAITLANLETRIQADTPSMANPMTTGGDLIYGGASGLPTRLANGTVGQVLTSGGTTVAPTWNTVAVTGDVSKVGTPANNQVGVWTGDGTIEGDAALTFDTATDVLSSGGLLLTGLTASQIVITDASKNLASAAVATYPSLTELTYVKGATSALQTQISALPTASSTTTFTNKTITQRVITTTDDATAVIDVTLTDVYELTAVANATTFSTTGTPLDGQNIIIRFKDAGVAKGLTWDAIFVAIGVTLPTTTVAGKWHYVGVKYNSNAVKFHALAVGVQA